MLNGIISKKIFAYVFLCLLCVSSFSLSAADLHVILVGDTAAAELQYSIVGDLQKIESHAQDISKYTGMTAKVKRITAHQARSQVVLDELNGLGTQDSDVVMFYFSGHGYRTPSKESNPWPNIYFATDQTGIDLLEIASILKDKAAHLTIILADCCNSSLPNHLAPPVAKMHHKPHGSEEKIKQNYHKLFVETNGQILIASSKAGQPSWSIGKEGSLYSNAYSDTFKYFLKRVQTNLLNWQFVLDQAAYKTHQVATRNGISQDPIYTIQ